MRNVLVYDKHHKYYVILTPVQEGTFFDQKQFVIVKVVLNLG